METIFISYHCVARLHKWKFQPIRVLPFVNTFSSAESKLRRDRCWISSSLEFREFTAIRFFTFATNYYSQVALIAGVSVAILVSWKQKYDFSISLDFQWMAIEIPDPENLLDPGHTSLQRVVAPWPSFYPKCIAALTIVVEEEVDEELDEEEVDIGQGGGWGLGRGGGLYLLPINSRCLTSLLLFWLTIVEYLVNDWQVTSQ